MTNGLLFRKHSLTTVNSTCVIAQLSYNVIIYVQQHIASTVVDEHIYQSTRVQEVLLRNPADRFVIRSCMRRSLKLRD